MSPPRTGPNVPKPRLALQHDDGEVELVATTLPVRLELVADGLVIWSSDGRDLAAQPGPTQLMLSVIQMSDAEVAAVPET